MMAESRIDHGIVLTDAVTIFALEAVAGGQASPRLIEPIALVEGLGELNP